MLFELDDFDVRDRFYQIEEKAKKLDLLLKAKRQFDQLRLQDISLKAFICHDAALDGLIITHEQIEQAFYHAETNTPAQSRLLEELANHRNLIFALEARTQKTKDQKDLYPNETVTVKDVIKWHKYLSVRNPKKEEQAFRGSVLLHSAYFHAVVEPAEISTQLGLLFRHSENPQFRMQHPINQAVLFHHEFMKVFPFSEGNGRIGRLLLNHFLMQGGYGLTIIHCSERQRYYETLGQEPEYFRDLLLDSMESTLEGQTRLLGEPHLKVFRPARGFARMEMVAF